MLQTAAHIEAAAKAYAKGPACQIPALDAPSVMDPVPNTTSRGCFGGDAEAEKKTGCAGPSGLKQGAIG